MILPLLVLEMIVMFVLEISKIVLLSLMILLLLLVVLELIVMIVLEMFNSVILVIEILLVNYVLKTLTLVLPGLVVFDLMTCSLDVKMTTLLNIDLILLDSPSLSNHFSLVIVNLVDNVIGMS